MIRRALTAAAAVAAMAFALPQTANAQSIYVLAGLAAPTGDFGDAADAGFFGAGGVTFPLGEAGVWAGGEALYGSNSHSSDVVDGSFKTLSVMGVLGYDIPTQSRVAPYVFGGAGFMSVDPPFDGADSESGFGWQLGGGVALTGESNVAPFLEGRYQSASLGDEDEGTDGTVSFFGIAAGVSIGVGN